MAKIFHRKFAEILKRTIVQKPCDENSVGKSVLDKIAGRDSRPVTDLKKSFHQEFFLLVVSSERPTYTTYTAQKMQISIKDFFSKCDQIRRKLRIWSQSLMKSLMQNFIFCALLVKTLVYHKLFSKNSF